MDVIDDGDDSGDEDYTAKDCATDEACAAKGDDVLANPHAGKGKGAASSALSLAAERQRKRKVDDAWADLTGGGGGGGGGGAAAAAAAAAAAPPPKKKTKKAKAKDKQKQKLLASIFGKTAASQLVDGAAAAAPKKAKAAAGKGKAKPIVRLAKVTNTKTMKFAGQTVTVKSSGGIGVAKAQAPAGGGGGGGGGGLSDMLNAIKGPKAISTVTKSAADWDTYKQDEGLEETLEGAEKKGYLAKQDFLDRVDQRKFELEKGQRETDRRKRERSTRK